MSHRFRTEIVDETGSTNSDVLAAAALGEREGLVRVARHQTAGRGRRDRVWEAPPGSSLLFSVLLRPSSGVVSVERVHLCTKAVALAARDVVAAAGGPMTLKWPNDVVIEIAPASEGEPAQLRKMGGILAETLIENGVLTAVVVGLGLNVHWPRPLPPDLADVAIALNHLVGDEATPSLDGLLHDLLERLEVYYSSLLADGGTTLLDHYRAACSTIGQLVRVERSTDVVEGRAEAVSDDGHLRVRTASGELVEVVVGDVVHVRPVVDR